MASDVTRRLKRLVGRDDEDALSFQCQRCEATFDANRQQCPDCGSFDIRRA
ncbi:hypothetical protein [Halobaculum sp. D14]|uniref:hypothetical protein n=1 Tax=unclassified Halobaculum TaxID=2640896 RepID=UPI003EB93A10